MTTGCLLINPYVHFSASRMSGIGKNIVWNKLYCVWYDSATLAWHHAFFASKFFVPRVLPYCHAVASLFKPFSVRRCIFYEGVKRHVDRQHMCSTKLSILPSARNYAMPRRILAKKPYRKPSSPRADQHAQSINQTRILRIPRVGKRPASLLTTALPCRGIQPAWRTMYDARVTVAESSRRAYVRNTAAYWTGPHTRQQPYASAN